MSFIMDHHKTWKGVYKRVTEQDEVQTRSAGM